MQNFLIFSTLTVILILAQLLQSQRLIYYSWSNQAGLSDRYFILTTLRSWAKIYDANVSFPRPCQALGTDHSNFVVNCSVGWDRYMEVDPPFFGYYSEGHDKMGPQPECKNQIIFSEETAKEFFNRPRDEVRKSSFCLDLQKSLYSATDWLGGILAKANISFTWNEFRTSPELFPKPSHHVISHTNKFLHGLGIVNHNYGILKIRRGDYSSIGKMSVCTQIPEVIHTWAALLNSYRRPNTEIPSAWLVFGDVEPGYWDNFKSNFSQLAAVPFVNTSQPLKNYVQRFIVEDDLRYSGKPLKEAFPDNYFLYAIILHLIRSTRFSIGGHGEGNFGNVCHQCGSRYCSGWRKPRRL